MNIEIPTGGDIFQKLTYWLLSSIMNWNWISYPIAIIFFTLFIKLIILPLDFFNRYFSKKNQLFVQKLAPELAELKKLYADNPLKLSQEQQKLYRKNGGATGGFMLITLGYIILTMWMFISIFGALREIAALNELTPIPFLWVTDIWHPDQLFIFPILAGAVSFLSIWINSLIQKKNMPQSVGTKEKPIISYSLRDTKTQTTSTTEINPQATGKVMMFVMPAIMLFFTIGYTVAMAIYVISSSIISTILGLILSFIIDIILKHQKLNKVREDPFDPNIINPHTRYFKDKGVK
ncbi:MAG: membrane protein insertase YidC [Christensenellaceae bacterium]|jgi:YidC/Oxa1 family membrane protein insertase|nr:membrane protein insertase YidC [Christensenellaceae bacterium]